MYRTKPEVEKEPWRMPRIKWSVVLAALYVLQLPLVGYFGGRVQDNLAFEVATIFAEILALAGCFIVICRDFRFEA